MTRSSIRKGKSRNPSISPFGRESITILPKEIRDRSEDFKEKSKEKREEKSIEKKAERREERESIEIEADIIRDGREKKRRKM